MDRSKRIPGAFKILVGLLVGGSFVHLGCAKEIQPSVQTAKPSPTPQLFEMGERLYKKQCAVCHGTKGAGDGQAAYLLYPKPRDFSQNKFRLVSTSTMEATDEDLFLTMTRGMPGSAMPSWEALTREERWALVYYVRSLTGKPNTQIPPESLIKVPPEAPRTTDGIERGRVLFAEACASCHGPLGKGDGPQIMKDDLGYPIKPRDLTAGIFKGSSESKELYYRVVAGLPGSPMPSFAGIYTDEQLWDLVHYVQSLVPLGVEERVRLHSKTIRARKIRGNIPFDFSAKVWEKATPTSIAVTPLWWRNERIEGLEVKALHNGKELAFYLAWNDKTRDNSTLTPQTFSDGVAVQFSLERDPPFFGMGDASGIAQIWHWKASWQEEMQAEHDVESVYPNAAVDWYPEQSDYRRGDPFEVSQAKTTSQNPLFMGGWGAENPLSIPKRHSAAEEAMARGVGTLTTKPPELQRVQAKGNWQEGRWQVVLHRPFTSKEQEDFKLRPGQKIHIAFAVWDGAAKDRNGQKSVSIWNTLILER